MNQQDFERSLHKHFPSLDLEKPLRDQMSSVDLANLVVVIEQEYGIEILPTEITSESFESISKLFSLVSTKVL